MSSLKSKYVLLLYILVWCIDIVVKLLLLNLNAMHVSCAARRVPTAQPQP